MSPRDLKLCDSKDFLKVATQFYLTPCALYWYGWISDSYANKSQLLYGHTHEYTHGHLTNIHMYTPANTYIEPKSIN